MNRAKGLLDPPARGVAAMSARFPSFLLDEIRVRVPISHVVARTVALERVGRELKGVSPFTQEKTASFFRQRP
jgi:DNA primase